MSIQRTLEAPPTPPDDFYLPFHVTVRDWGASGAEMATLVVLATLFYFMYGRMGREERNKGLLVMFWLSVCFFGHALRLGWVWPLLRSFTNPGSFGSIADYWWVDVVGVVMSIFGSVGFVREIAVEGDGNAAAIIAVMFIVCGTLLMHMIW